jgi:LPXTG-site transpeptidase (sortase) family protein
MFSKNSYSREYKKETLKQRKVRYKNASRAFAFSNVLLVFGLLIFVYFVAIPVLNSVISKPKSMSYVKPFTGTVLGVMYTSLEDDFYFSELAGVDVQASSVSKDIDEFTITIPKLEIKDALIKANTDDLNPEGFIGHYKGTPFPGEVGNSFIYGHSTLPFFYDPTNYKSVFTKIPDLVAGDIVKINIEGKDLIYKVKLGKELLPSEVNVMGAYYSSMYNKSTITLMTCTPPGTKKNRYIVLAELQ